MKITKIEKAILGIIAVIILFISVAVAYTVNAIYEAGGVKATIVEAGKEIKDIVEQVDNNSQARGDLSE